MQILSIDFYIDKLNNNENSFVFKGNPAFNRVKHCEKQNNQTLAAKAFVEAARRQPQKKKWLPPKAGSHFKNKI